ncbi:hypothetical protein DICPUDRAFT_93521 [Dictyostelium purpureum]|uniref:non-specific serine/threonine protein kinase n=1 Tax=Dictyostelium purpureum TaxID=5786 RepID=F0Z8G5_DICPU|nr:uncharacterized protein DICPUDRAFT_93521 [Dictyostelium purpureum]EGC39722.1 hypothetical protein DICPUDRAFT_93521 [Dictyostelium purpureum]|eukprot:XP_003283708.1 hypothetical protein DICPUDRAFT_93521 [Dictyostelium purpureum]
MTTLNVPKETMSRKDPEKYFTIIEKLGEGSYGSVYKAINAGTGIVVAIKRVSVDNDLEDMEKEINFMKQCKSPYIVTYHASFRKENEVWIVMEYCGAGSVCDAMKITNKTLSEDQIAVVSRDVLQGLAYLHSVRKIHRDIKAGNILMNHKGESKLADFGVSGQLSDTMAKRQTVIGTPFWMAPEVIQEVGYDYKADIWSYGITCIEMAESKPPLFNVHPMRVIFMIPNPSRPPPKLTEPEKWSPEFNDFLAKCLTRKPEQRPSAEELLKHPFITRAKSHSLLVPLIDEQDIIINEKGREVALGIEQKDEEEEDLEDEDSDDSDIDRGTMVPRNNSGDEEYDTGTMVITDNKNSYDTVVFNNDDEDTGTMKLKSTMTAKKGFIPDYMNQFKKTDDDNKYSSHSLDDLKKMLADLEIEREKEVQKIHDRFSINRQALLAVIEEKKATTTKN